MDPLWRIEMLGELRAVQGQGVLTRFRTRQAGLLLAYLAYHLQRSHPREELIEMLWPEGDPRSGRNGLPVSLSSLRRQLESPGTAPGAVLVTEGAAVRLRAAACVTDVSLFQAIPSTAAQANNHTERAQRLTEAVELYRGELLPGYFEEWVLQDRQRLAEAHLQALHELARMAEESGDRLRVVKWARQAVAADPPWEEG